MTNNVLLKTNEGIQHHGRGPLLPGMGKAIAPISTVGNPPLFSNLQYIQLEQNAITANIDQNYILSRKTADDACRYKARNSSIGPRVVLLSGTVRPFKTPFSAIKKCIIRLIIGSSHVTKAVRHKRKWGSKFNKLFS